MSKPATIDEYINTAPPLGHALLNELRTLCRDAAPDAVEQIKWGHPAYVHPDGVILFMFSGHKAHASFAFTPTTRAAFQAELTHYRTGKGTAPPTTHQNDPVPSPRTRTRRRQLDVTSSGTPKGNRSGQYGDDRATIPQAPSGDDSRSGTLFER